MNNRDDERLQGHDVNLNSASVATKERERGKLYRWFDNFWYHHKWKTLIIGFCLIVVLICTLQMCNKESEGDISILTAGPYGFMTADSGLGDLRNCLANYLPDDYDEDGVRKVDVRHYTVYSEDQIKTYAAQNITINTADNSSEYKSFYGYIATGETSVLFLDPWLYEEMQGKLMDIVDLAGVVPVGGITITDDNGKTHCYGVRLGDTALYANTAMQVLPEDTVICLAAPLYVGGKSSDEAEFAKAVAYLKALVGIKE